MGLEKLTSIVEDRKKVFEQSISQAVDTLPVQDVLDEIKDEKPWYIEGNCLIFKKGPYKITLFNNTLNLFGYENLVHRSFEGDETTKFYQKLLADLSEE